MAQHAVRIAAAGADRACRHRPRPDAREGSRTRDDGVHSQGIPRNINAICDNALLIGYAKNEKRIDSSIVKEAIQDRSWEEINESYENSGDSLKNEQILHVGKRSFFSRFSNIVGILIVLCFLIAGFLFYKNYQNQLRDIIDSIVSR